jgi:hypothetical protein
MSGSLGLLLGLIVLSYVGTVFSGSRFQRLFGLPSGAEYLILGFTLGPIMLGVIERSWVETFAPVMVMGSAWLALITGLDCGRASHRNARPRMALGALLTALVALGISASAWLGIGFLPELMGVDRLTLALGIGALGCVTTQHAVRWTITGTHGRGLLSTALLDLSRASPLIPVLLLGVIQSGATSPELATLSVPLRICVGLSVGAVLGGLAALLLGREFRRDESWGLMMGVSLFATGVCAGLGLSAVAATFTLGLTLGLASEHREEIRAMILPTERSVVLPVALLAGASLNPVAFPTLGILCLLVLAVRGVLELARGAVICGVVKSARPAGAMVGLSLTSGGSFILAAAVELALHFNGATGTMLLTVGAAVLLAGEAVGPFVLRRSLVRAGDIPAPSALPLTPAPSALEHS